VTTPADELMAAFASRRLIPPFTDRESALDGVGDYHVAAEVHRRRVDRGETPVGRKIGFTNRTIWDQYGVWARSVTSTRAPCIMALVAP
jgi:2-oxo-3-hexenedioate decarboxylase